MKDKIPFYNIVNMFFVGSIFSFVLAVLFNDYIDLTNPLFDFLKEWKIIVSALLIITMYEVGFIINRLSSIIIAPILEKTKIRPKEKYNIDISKISESNSKFQSMITELVLMRSHILAYLILGMLSLISNYKWLSIICVFLIVTFIVAGRKHNTRINIIRKSFEKEENERKTREKDVHNFLAYNGTSQEDN